jgi:hypothetical protein
MAKPANSQPKLSDAERHARFKDMAKEVGASEDPKDFEDAFRRVTESGRQSEGRPDEEGGQSSGL